jgi:hypothetical protein
MDCSVLWDHSFDLTVAWKKDNIDVRPDGEKFVQEQNNSLIIRNLQFDDSGRPVSNFNPIF